MNNTIIEPTSQIYYNYLYTDPRKSGRYTYEGLNFSLLYEPFYIGKGYGYRYKKHLEPYQLNKKSHKNNKINKIKQTHNMLDYIIIFNKNSTNNEAIHNEIKIIKSIGRIDLNTGTLTNLTDGGEGSCVYSSKYIQKLSLRMSGNNNPMSKFYLMNSGMDEEQAIVYLKAKGKKSGDSKRGIPLTKIHKKNISLSTKGKSYEERYGKLKTIKLKKERSIQTKSKSYEEMYGKNKSTQLKNNLKIKMAGRIKTTNEKEKRKNTLKKNGSLNGIKNPMAKTYIVKNHTTGIETIFYGSFTKYCENDKFRISDIKNFYLNEGKITEDMIREKLSYLRPQNFSLKCKFHIKKYLMLEFICN